MVLIDCVIYKSHKKTDSYLFIERENEFSRVPEALLDMLGKLEFVMALELTSERKLARVSAIEVMQHLSEHGFYLQLPPNDVLKQNVFANLVLGD